MHAVRLGCGIWIANVHASAGEGAALHDGHITAATALHWAEGDPLAVGGDFNLRLPEFPGLRHVAARDVDHVFVADGVRAAGGYQVLDRGTLSDHPPLAVTVSWD
jgi:endonuclease/exonuclease/phosphatase family metal-dependent hydrolase